MATIRFKNTDAASRLCGLDPLARHQPKASHPFARQISVVITSMILTAHVANTAVGQPGAPPSPVVVSRVMVTSQPASQSFVGTLVPIRKSVIGSAIDGRVVDVLVDNGDAVGMLEGQFDENGQPIGQPIVQLRTGSLDIEIEAAEVELRIRRDAEQETRTMLPLDIESATAAIEEIKARLKYSKSDYDRLKSLAETGGIPRREIDEAFSNYAAQQQSNIVAESLLKKFTETREVRLSQAQFRVDAQLAELRRLRDLKDKYTIRTPFAGYVTLKMTELGDWVARGDDVMEIVQLDPIELMVNVPQSYIGRLQASLDEYRRNNSPYLAQVSVESISTLITGEVVRIVPQADLRSRSFPVIIRIDNPGSQYGHLLKAGMLANASLFVGRDEEITLVKKDALVLGGRETSLYVTGTDPAGGGTVVRPVSVTIGAAIGDWIQVTGGVVAGELVVIEGNERLRPGQAVQIIREDSATLPQVSSPSASSQSNSISDGT